MRILFVTHRYPPHTGGVETHVREIATRLADSGHEVTVFSADAGSDVPTGYTDHGVRVRRFRSVSPAGAFYVAPQMALAVSQADADVVHAHNYHAFPLFFAALGVTNEHFVVTTHYHGQSESDFRDSLLSLYRPLGRGAVKRAEDVIAVSEWEQEQLAADLNVEATVIPNGIDVERFKTADPEERDRPFCLCVGRLEEYKGVQHVIRALEYLPGYDLLVAGEGPYRSELERIAREVGVEERVEFLGFVDEDRLPGLYAGSEVCLSMSALEAYGITIGEALASGTRCIVRNQAALRDWGGHPNVVAIDDPTPEQIAEAVETDGGDPSFPPLPTWDNVKDELLELYKNGSSEANRTS